VWGEIDRLRGLKLTFEDGAEMQAGSLEGQVNSSITLHADESITSTIISSSTYRAGRAGNLQLQTDFGQKYLGGAPSCDQVLSARMVARALTWTTSA
jgi:hypothetical protein